METEDGIRPADGSGRPERMAWLIGGQRVRPENRSILLEVIVRVLFHSIIVVSLYLLFAGHNLPGGGFAGGLVAGMALVMRYIAGGRYELGAAAPTDAGRLLGVGMTIAVACAVIPLLFGLSPLTSAFFETGPPGCGAHRVRHLDAVRHRGLPRGDRPRARRAAQPRGGSGPAGAAAEPTGGERLMDVSLVLIVIMAVLYACGVYAMLERSLTRVLIGFLLLGNATNLLLLIVMGRPGIAPFFGAGETDDMSDALPQALTLTAIVITFAISAFLLALIYRSWQLGQEDTVEDDAADIAVRARSVEAEDTMDDDTAVESDDTVTDFVGLAKAPITVLGSRDYSGIRDDAPTDEATRRRGR